MCSSPILGSQTLGLRQRSALMGSSAFFDHAVIDPVDRQSLCLPILPNSASLGRHRETVKPVLERKRTPERSRRGRRLIGAACTPAILQDRARLCPGNLQVLGKEVSEVIPLSPMQDPGRSVGAVDDPIRLGLDTIAPRGMLEHEVGTRLALQLLRSRMVYRFV